MNKERRAEITKAVSLMQDALGIIETVAGEEREYYDNMPEAMQGGEKGEKADEDAGNLEQAQSNLEEDISNLESMIE